MSNQDRISVELFGIPSVLKNNKKILFPLRKAEALFYYLLVSHQATREELADLFWGKCDEKIAKKNLRNALYNIRKAFESDIIISPQKHIVLLNQDIKIETDLENFLKNGPTGIKAYTGEFLQGFVVKDAEKFTEWVRNKAEFLRELYITKLYKCIDKDLKKKEKKHIEQYAKMIIKSDEFNERAYQILMKSYAEKGAFNKVIEIYNKLSDVLDKELGIKPDAKTKELYIKILETRKLKEAEVESHTEDFFFGRQDELQTLKKEYEKFIQNRNVESVIIIGEAGVGKTKLKDEFIKNIHHHELFLIETECYQAEEGYPLKPWNAIFSKIYDFLIKEKIDIPIFWKSLIAYLFPSFATEQTPINLTLLEKLDTLKPKVIEDAIVSILDKISKKKRLLLIFEDLQWIDSMSLSLLSSILLHLGNRKIYFIGTLRSGYYKEINTFIILMSKYNRLKRMELNRFSKEEVEGFIDRALPEYKISANLKKRLYEETEGNAFFLMEYLNILREKKDINLMTSKMQDILNSRVIDISEEGKKVLNIISLFFDEISLDVLKKVSGKDELKIMDIIEELKSKFIIKETSDSDKISYRFTHQKLRDFIYSLQSLARQKILHNKIGLILERDLKNDKRDFLVYPNLVYHFINAGNWTASLKYSIKNAQAYLDISHELFPELSDMVKKGNTYLQISKEIALKYLDDIEKLIKKVKLKGRIPDDLAKQEIEYWHMKGRHLIREGEYKKGIELINQVIQNSLKIGYKHYALKGYKQVVFYAIQTHNVHLMKENLERALALAKGYNFQKDIGTLLRLKGLSQIMSGHCEEAEALLRDSIRIFRRLNKKEDKYSLNIAAAYNYIGDIRKHKKNFSDALTYYLKAITISKDKKVPGSLAFFSTNAGLAAFESGDYYRAKMFFKKAIQMYNQYDTFWGRSTAEAYSSLFLVKEGHYKEALKRLKRADEFSQKLKSPYEMGLTYRVKAEIRTKMETNKTLNNIFSAYLNQDINEYCHRGIDLLRRTKTDHMIHILETLSRQENLLFKK